MRITVTGATGGVGRRLVEAARAAGDQVVVLSRDADRARAALGDVEAHSWDPRSGPPPAAALEGAGAVVNLAGESVAQRWTDDAKQRIFESRVTGTQNLVAGILAASTPPPILISGSAHGIYGDVRTPVDESSPRGEGFLADVCEAWEAEARKAEGSSVRVVLLRTGDVLMDDDGVVQVLAKLSKLGALGPLGSGKQPFPWIHVDDEVGLILHALQTAEASGPLNAVAPGIVTQAELAKAFGRILRRPSFIPAPAFAVRLLRGEMSELILEGANVKPVAAERLGYSFKWPELDPALRDVLS